MISTVQDVTEQERTKKALEESHAKYRQLVEQSPFGISLIDKDGRYQYLNPKFREMFGYGLEDIPTGKEWFQKAYPEEKYRREVVKIWKEDQRNTGVGEARPRTYNVICKDGQKKVIYFRSVTMENSDQLVFYEDVTETEILEKQLRRAHRVEAVATLTGGIAHDYNNLVSIIMGNLGLAMQEAETETALSHFLKEANRATDKVRDLTHELMALSRGGAPVKEVVSLKPVLKHSAKIIPADSGILIEEFIKEGLWAVPHDPHKLDAVFRNILTNAVEAMPQGGTITITAENLRIDDLDQDPGLALKAG
ncbi:MAG: PAS domain S-box protein [Deltaproteobacteria bacterium]|nr:PAS domain S-box protein [Deltaproteobacteria bacterium]